jgi:hypothetical protein
MLPVPTAQVRQTAIDAERQTVDAIVERGALVTYDA